MFAVARLVTITASVMDDSARRAMERAALQDVARLMRSWAARLDGDSVLGARFADHAERALLALRREEGPSGG